MGDQFAQNCLNAHNEYRRKHGAKPLVLDARVLYELYSKDIFNHNFLLLQIFPLKKQKRLVPSRNGGPIRSHPAIP